MALVGAEMVNPVTKERFVWRQTAASTGGKFVEVDLFVEEGAAAAAHVHPQQREDFRVEAGTLQLRVGRETHILNVGDEHSVPPGTVHHWHNVGKGKVHMALRFTPAMRTEEFFETFCGLARDGKVSKRGVPSNPLQMGVLFHEYRREVAGPAPARYVAGPVIAMLAKLGARRGLRSRYPEYSAD